MTEIAIAVKENLVETAFSRVVVTPTATLGTDGALYAGGLSQFDSAVTEVWRRIKEVADESFQLGWEATKTKFRS